MRHDVEKFIIVSMSNFTWQENWHSVTNHEAHQITGSTNSPGLVYQYPVTALPSQLQAMPGIYAAYCSGYCSTYVSPENVTVGGELLVAREDQGTGKGYVYLFGCSGSDVCFAGPYKPYDGHHYDTCSGVPTDKLFGKIPPNKA